MFSYYQESYRILHERQGGVKLFVEAACIILEEPKQLHNVSHFAWKMEEEIHQVQEDKSLISTCWRKKIGSNKTASRVFEYLEPPTRLQKIIASLDQHLNKQFRLASI